MCKCQSQLLVVFSTKDWLTSWLTLKTITKCYAVSSTLHILFHLSRHLIIIHIHILLYCIFQTFCPSGITCNKSVMLFFHGRALQYIKRECTLTLSRCYRSRKWDKQVSESLIRIWLKIGKLLIFEVAINQTEIGNLWGPLSYLCNTKKKKNHISAQNKIPIIHPP